jgi:hypothetical protein
MVVPSFHEVMTQVTKVLDRLLPHNHTGHVRLILLTKVLDRLLPHNHTGHVRLILLTKVLDRLLPHNHTGHVRLILLLPGTFHTCDSWPVPVWKGEGVFLGDSVLTSPISILLISEEARLINGPVRYESPWQQQAIDGGGGNSIIRQFRLHSYGRRQNVATHRNCDQALYDTSMLYFYSSFCSIAGGDQSIIANNRRTSS